MATIDVIKLPDDKRSPMTHALLKRHGVFKTPMKDRRTPRGGSHNRQREYREERY